MFFSASLCRAVSALYAGYFLCGVSAGDFPSANFTFAVYQTYILPMANGALADCKFLVCRRQMKSLPIASVSLADGKILTG